ncbi:MAG: type IV secretory system conjugative DNA transfer family protein, partial [Clostridiaceae bacterium]|nr:type IV secretory system conjugative DNA transfer family protein [Clostridiaceae bacterium]
MFNKFINQNKTTRKESYNNRERLMNLNRLLSSIKSFTLIYIVFAIAIVLIATYMMNIIEQFPSWFKSISVLEGGSEVKVNWNIVQMFQFRLSYKWIYLVILILLLIGYVKSYYEVQVAYKDLNVGQKGTARWTTKEEIKQQYRAVPDSKEVFKGGGGIPIARDGNKLYIDDSPVNNLIIGITRSGKGELEVFPEIDIYSRAEKKASMIITDPKLELAAATIPELKRRGYEYHILNLVDPEYSMGFNPLSAIIEEYKDGNLPNAELLCSSFCFSIFNPDEAGGDEKFWADTSTSLLTALIMAAVEDNVRADRELNKQREYEHLKIEKKRKEAAINKLSDKDKELYKLNEEIKHIESFIPEPTNEELAEELERPLYEIEEARNSKVPVIDYSYNRFEPVYENEKNINMYSIINTFSVLSNIFTADGESELDAYFNNRPEGNIARLKYAGIGMAGEKTKGSIYSNTLSKLQVFTYENIAKMTARSTVDLSTIGFGKKPVAIFIGIPDYDRSNHFIASVFIRQVYF